MQNDKIYSILNLLRAQNPHPTTELIYHSTFELLIAVILSAQATDLSVNKVTQKLFIEANTPGSILALGEEGLKPLIKSIGLYNTKAHNVIQTCHLLVTKYASQVPKTREELESLPGVGRKTANVILNTAFGESTIAVDTHVFRVARRLGLAYGKTPQAIERALLNCIPTEFLQNAHHWLVLHGRYVCTAKKPACRTCILHDLCENPLYI